MNIGRTKFLSIPAFPAEFIHLNSDSRGIPDSAKVLRQFESPDRDASNQSNALNDCVEYCATYSKCWGCTLHCNLTCHSNAIAASVKQDASSVSNQFEVYQKPGNKR